MARPWMRRIRSANGECESTQRAELEVGQDSRAPTRHASFSPRRDQPPRQSQGRIDGQHQERNCKHKQQQQLPRAGACLVLLFEKTREGSFRSAG